MDGTGKAKERAARAEITLCEISAIFSLLALLDEESVQRAVEGAPTDFRTALVNIGRLGQRLTEEALSEVSDIPTELDRRDADAG